MNIFELIVADPNAYHQLTNDYTNHTNNWTLYKHNLLALNQHTPNEIEPLLARSRDIWAHALRSSPQLISSMIQNYLTFIDNLIDSTLDPALTQIASTLGTNPNFIEMEISSSLEIVYEKYLIHERYIRIFDQQNRYQDIFKNKIHALLVKYDLQTKLPTLLQKCYFKNSLNILQSEILDFDEAVSEHIRQRSSHCQNFSYQAINLKTIFEKLIVLGLAEDYFEPFYDFLNRESQLFITECTSFGDNPERREHLTKCLNFQRTFQRQLLKTIKAPLTEQFFNHFINQLDDNIYYLYAKHCSSNILDIILDLPESKSVIDSLRRCLEKAPLLNQVGQSLCREIQKRLLIPGVLTEDILNKYIDMLKVLQILDPQGIIFEKITLPIKNYLLKRNDTLRCIISHLTGGIDKYSQATQQKIFYPSKKSIEEESSEQDQNNAKQWQVIFVKEHKIKRRVKYQEIDLVTVLVGLYGSQQAFIGEYQNMMAQKLMTIKKFDTTEERKNIELLKMRFGESALQTCNIILKDVDDSKRNDTVIHAMKGPSLPKAPISIQQLHCLSVSKGYWPINYEAPQAFHLPPGLKLPFDQYAKRFSDIKAMRKLYFHYNLGYVNLTLSFDNGDFDFKCLPIQAIMITYLDEDKMKDPRSGVSSEQLSNQLHITPNIVKQKMSFWVHKGVVKETRVHKQGSIGLSLRKMASTLEDGDVIYYRPVSVYENIPNDEIDDQFQSTLMKESSTMESHLKHIIEGLILSILNTNGPKSMEKIHLLLKTVYKTDLDYTYGQVQTAEILKKMLQKKRINYNGEVYSSKDQ